MSDGRRSADLLQRIKTASDQELKGVARFLVVAGFSFARGLACAAELAVNNESTSLTQASMSFDGRIGPD